MKSIKDIEKARKDAAAQAATSYFNAKASQEPETALSAGLSTEPKATTELNSEPTNSVTPKKKGRPKVTRETKQRYAITLLPSLYAKAGDKAAEQGRSLSEVIGRYLEGYIKE